MKISIFKIGLFALLLSTVGMVGCSDSDEDNLTGNDITYDLEERSASGIDGKIIFSELVDGRVQAEIDLSGTTNGTSMPAHIHANSAAVGGDILVSLDPVDGATGSSVTIFNMTDDGAIITYDDILNLDAYVNVHKSSSELDVIFAQGDIGSNLLTGESKTYDLKEKDVAGISGKVIFEQRRNGFTKATIELDGTPNGGMHPAHIHANSAAEGGSILVSFNPVNGSSGTSVTGIRQMDNGDAMDYEDILTINGYVNVHLSSAELSTIVAQGDIGSNELTGESSSYDLNTKDVAGIQGEVMFEQRVDGTILATIDLTGTPNGGMHPAHIHENSAAEGGPIIVSFNPVDGNSGRSITTLRMMDDGSALNYQMIENLDAYVNVHLSAEELGTIVAQGDIGVNN